MEGYVGRVRLYITYGRDEKRIKILVGNPEGKRPVGKSVRSLKDNIKRNFKEMGYTVVQLATALSYKVEGHGFVSRCVHWDCFNELIFPAAL
jgi:hypothetical protein